MYCSSKKILSLVEGFLAALGFLFLTKLPKPLISILSPFAKDFLIVFKKESRTSSVSTFVKPVNFWMIHLLYLALSY